MNAPRKTLASLMARGGVITHLLVERPNMGQTGAFLARVSALAVGTSGKRTARRFNLRG